MIRISRLTLISLLLSGMVFQAGFTAAAYSEPGGSGGLTERVPELHSQILYSILSLHFGEADSLLEISLELDPGNSETLYLQNYLEFLNVLISGDMESFGGYIEASGKRVESIRAGRTNYPGSDSDLSSIHLQSSVLCAYHGEMFKSARHFYYSYRYLRKSEEADPGEVRNLRNRGLSTLIIGSVPEEYRWLLTVFGMKGDIEEGFGFLEEYHAEAGGPERLEACLILMFGRHMIDPGEGDLSVNGDCRIDSLTLYRYALALKDLGSGNSEKVIENLLDYRQEEGERKFVYPDLLLGEAMLNKLDTGAYVQLERFARNHGGDHYRHYAWHKLSWCYALNGEWDRYRDARQEVLGSGEPYLDADRQALSEALDTLPLNTDLLKARLLFDGGYYQDALGRLEDRSAVLLRNRRDSIEYNYRLARIYDRLGDRDRAVAYYEEVIASGSGEAWYFAPNAALHLGMISEKEGNPDKALEYYRECLKINKSAYKKSIDYKARQGIRRLENL